MKLDKMVKMAVENAEVQEVEVHLLRQYIF
jgi:hypothetical protein